MPRSGAGSGRPGCCGAACRNDVQFAGGGVTMPDDSLVELRGAAWSASLAAWRRSGQTRETSANTPRAWRGGEKPAVAKRRARIGGFQSRSKSRSGFSMGASLAFFRPSANLRARTSSFVLSASTDARNFASTESVCSRSRRAVSSRSIDGGALTEATCERTTPSVAVDGQLRVAARAVDFESTCQLGFFAMARILRQWRASENASAERARRHFGAHSSERC